MNVCMHKVRGCIDLGTEIKLCLLSRADADMHIHRRCAETKRRASSPPLLSAAEPRVKCVDNRQREAGREHLAPLSRPASN